MNLERTHIEIDTVDEVNRLLPDRESSLFFKVNLPMGRH